MARLALQKIDSGDTSLARHLLLDSLAWACHKCGLDDEALLHSRAAHDALTAAEMDEYAGYTQKLEASVAAWRSADGSERVSKLREQLAALDAEVSVRHQYELVDGGERFLHQTLSRLIDDLRAFTGEKGEFAAVKARLAEAESVQARTIDAHRQQWDTAIAAIAASPKYGGFRLTPQLGLVPLAEDPVSGLWEFVHLASGTKGLEFPERDATTQRLLPTGDMGIVFVLLPGGTFQMGAQRADPKWLNFDTNAVGNQEPVNEVTLAPFFMGKYELTQGQWARLWSGDEKDRQPSLYKAGSEDYVGGKITLADPVEQVDWPRCDRLMRRHGLSLPTEAQWEYGCRAGTTTPWLCAFDELVRYANLADASAKRAGAMSGAFEDWDDKHAVHAQVGSFLPNGFGLHDVLGNVAEWCLDEYGSYSDPVRPGDGLRLHGNASGRTCSPAATTKDSPRSRGRPTATTSPGRTPSATSASVPPEH